MKFSVVIIPLLISLTSAKQSWVEQPAYQEVNPGGEVILPCVIRDKQGKCSWELDGKPIGHYPGKYEWAGTPESGDCSLRVMDAELEYDNGVWQCQITASNFKTKDVLVSQGAELVVRESPTSIEIEKVGDASSEDRVTASAGEVIDLECVVLGANPPAKLKWFTRNGIEVTEGHSQEDTKVEQGRKLKSVSRLSLPVSREDNGGQVSCRAMHPTLTTPLEATVNMNVHYKPTVRIETSSLDYLEERKHGVTLKCITDSNPPATVLWRKQGLNGIFSPDREITFSPVTRDTAGTYSCTAENAIDVSEPAYVEVDVKYAPSIMSVGPSKVVHARMGQKTVLTCEADGNPEPKYQWLQRLPGNEGVLIRGYERNLVIEKVTYEHQGEFVCKATNDLESDRRRSVQSEPIRVEVSGAPKVVKYSSKQEVYVQSGQDAELEVVFCADPIPRQAWNLGLASSTSNGSNNNNVILVAGSGHGRFVAESSKPSDIREKCYISKLRIARVTASDSHVYTLELSNEHGEDKHEIKLVVNEFVSQGSLIAVAVGIILTLIILILVLVYCCKSSSCCSSRDSSGKKMNNLKSADIESDKTDVESTRSSNVSASHVYRPNHVIPPDALYSHNEKAMAPLNESKESLRPEHVHSHYSHNMSNLNRTNSSSGELNMSKISYNDLCFPKTSNYGSMKKKKRHNVGVECKLQQNNTYVPNQVPVPEPSLTRSRNYY